MAETQKALAEANRQLALQTDKASSLANEKSFLQHKLSLLSTDSANSTALQSTRKALADANRQIIDQKSLSERLASEKQTLQARLDALSSANHAPPQESASEMAALRAENALLKKQLAAAKEMPPASGEDLARELSETRVQLAALQSDKELWRLEKLALENRVRQLQATALPHGPEIASATTVPPSAAPMTPRDAKTVNRIKQLEQERDDLRKRLEAANKELSAKKSQSGATKVEELQNQLASLQARLDAFEARQVPYTTEELALFKRPQPKLASAEVQAKPAQQSIEQLSPATARLIVEARGYFSSAEYDKAESAYLEATRQDDKNVPILANLAAIQIERARFDSAETNIHKALSLLPNDPYTLFVLGNLKFRQGKYDEALEALSRAAKLDPSNAEVQNYLGLTLSEKGMRVPAETALRKAIDLDPNYGSAHNNLAVIYLTQQPPALELARFHYEKALAAGAPHNPELEKLLEHKEGGEKRASE
jgi:Flp pilus assembly protein TadD